MLIFVCRWSYDTTSGADKFDTARCYRCKRGTDYTCIYTKGSFNIALNHDSLITAAVCACKFSNVR